MKSESEENMEGNGMCGGEAEPRTQLFLMSLSTARSALLSYLRFLRHSTLLVDFGCDGGDENGESGRVRERLWD